jgi:hypothetical protein
MGAGHHADGLPVNPSIASHHVLQQDQSAHTGPPQLVWITGMELFCQLRKLVNLDRTEDRAR